MVPQPVRLALSALLVGMIIGGPLAYWRFYKSDSRNFRVVREGVLYRSGQLTLPGLKKAIHDHRIKTVISCRIARKEGDPHPDHKEEEYCRYKGIHFFRIPTRPWGPDEDGNIPADESTRKFCEIVKNPENHPILVHCFAGKHRTGSYCAVYRIEFENWSNEKAIEEMVLNGYDNIEEHRDLLGYLQNYQPQFCSWANGDHGCNHEECCVPSCSCEACSAYQQEKCCSHDH